MKIENLELSGEQFSLPEAVELVGIITSGERVRALASTRIAYRDGIAISAIEGDYLRPLAVVETSVASEAAALLAGRRVPVSSGFVGRTA